MVAMSSLLWYSAVAANLGGLRNIWRRKMKNLIFGLVVAAAVVGCGKEEVVDDTSTMTDDTSTMTDDTSVMTDDTAMGTDEEEGA